MGLNATTVPASLPIRPLYIEADRLGLALLETTMPVLVGSVLLMASAQGHWCFAQVERLQVVNGHPQLETRVIKGTPTLQLAKASLLHPDQVLQEVFGTGPLTVTLWDRVTCDAHHLQGVSGLVAPSDAELAEGLSSIVEAWSQEYRTLVLDTCGWFGQDGSDTFHTLTVGEDVALSPKRFGWPAFIDWLLEGYPDFLRDEAHAQLYEVMASFKQKTFDVTTLLNEAGDRFPTSLKFHLEQKAALELFTANEEKALNLSRHLPHEPGLTLFNMEPLAQEQAPWWLYGLQQELLHGEFPSQEMALAVIHPELLELEAVERFAEQARRLGLRQLWATTASVYLPDKPVWDSRVSMKKNGDIELEGAVSGGLKLTWPLQPLWRPVVPTTLANPAVKDLPGNLSGSLKADVDDEAEPQAILAEMAPVVSPHEEAHDEQEEAPPWLQKAGDKGQPADEAVISTDEPLPVAEEASPHFNSFNIETPAPETDENDHYSSFQFDEDATASTAPITESELHPCLPEDLVDEVEEARHEAEAAKDHHEPTQPPEATSDLEEVYATETALESEAAFPGFDEPEEVEKPLEAGKTLFPEANLPTDSEDDNSTGSSLTELDQSELEAHLSTSEALDEDGPERWLVPPVAQVAQATAQASQTPGSIELPIDLNDADAWQPIEPDLPKVPASSPVLGDSALSTDEPTPDNSPAPQSSVAEDATEDLDWPEEEEPLSLEAEPEAPEQPLGQDRNQQAEAIEASPDINEAIIASLPEETALPEAAEAAFPEEESDWPLDVDEPEQDEQPQADQQNERAAPVTDQAPKQAEAKPAEGFPLDEGATLIPSPASEDEALADDLSDLDSWLAETVPITEQEESLSRLFPETNGTQEPGESLNEDPAADVNELAAQPDIPERLVKEAEESPEPEEAPQTSVEPEAVEADGPSNSQENLEVYPQTEEADWPVEEEPVEAIQQAAPEPEVTSEAPPNEAPTSEASAPAEQEQKEQTPDQQETASDDDVSYQEGDTVHHEKYGAGTVQKVMSMEGRVILNIQFEQVGKRLLDPNLSPLNKQQY